MKSDFMLFLELVFIYILSGNNGPSPDLPRGFAAFLPKISLILALGSYSFLVRY